MKLEINSKTLKLRNQLRRPITDIRQDNLVARINHAGSKSKQNKITRLKGLLLQRIETARSRITHIQYETKSKHESKQNNRRDIGTNVEIKYPAFDTGA